MSRGINHPKVRELSDDIILTYIIQFCKINPLCTVAPDEIIPNHTVIYGHNERHVDRSGMEELRTKGVEQQVELLKRAEYAARKK